MSSILKKAWKAIPKVTQEITNPTKVDMMGDYRKSYQFKTKFGMIGPVSAGKSTVCAGIVYVCQNLSALVPNFYARVLPTSSRILQDANNLRRGKFPEKTDPTKPEAPEAGLLISQRGMTGNKGVHVPICDVAGEVTDYLEETGGTTPAERINTRASSINQVVVNTVRDCQGFIIALDANDSILFSDGEHDNDVYIHSAMTNILDWRRRNHRPDPYVIVVLTKWDEVMTRAKDLQMDAYDGEYGLQRFLDNSFPSTAMLLKPLRDKGMVKFFRSWFTLARDKNTNEILHWDGTDKPKIEIEENPSNYIRFKPKMAEPDYINLINYIGSFGG